MMAKVVVHISMQATSILEGRVDISANDCLLLYSLDVNVFSWLQENVL